MTGWLAGLDWYTADTPVTLRYREIQRLRGRVFHTIERSLSLSLSVSLSSPLNVQHTTDGRAHHVGPRLILSRDRFFFFFFLFFFFFSNGRWWREEGIIMENAGEGSRCDEEDWTMGEWRNGRKSFAIYDSLQDNVVAVACWWGKERGVMRLLEVRSESRWRVWSFLFSFEVFGKLVELNFCV